jgi:hypothetical protein
VGAPGGHRGTAKTGGSTIARTSLRPADYYPDVPNDEGLAEVLERVRERIASFSSRSIGEQNTKVGLIAPILRAVGWDVENLHEVHLEYRRRPADKPVDYALMLNGAPRLFVEAKGLGENLEDRRWANQIMGYAVVAGVRWVVLSNGDEYRLYNSHAAVPVEEKLFRQVRVTGDDSDPAETLALISKESIAELEALWQEDFVDKQVSVALDALFEPEPDEGIVRLLRRRLPQEFTPRQIREAILRLRSPSGGDASIERLPLTEPVSVNRSEEPETQGRSHGEGTPWSEVKLGDIISAGLLHPPVDLYRRYKGQDLRARIESDGRVSFGGGVYGSLSVAGMMARRSIIGADRRAQTNGWTFWRYEAPDGQLHEIDELRRGLWKSRSSSG